MNTNQIGGHTKRIFHESNFIYRYCQHHRANNGPPLHEAIKKFCLKTVTCYLDRCSFNIEAIDICGQRPLHCAVRSGFEAAVILLLERGAKINGRDKKGNTALHHAVIKNNVKLAKLLIDNGCEIDIQGTNKQTPFLIAVKMKLPILIELLLLKGCNVNAKDKYGNTALHFIYKFKYWETYEKLTDSDLELDKPEDVNIVTGQRYCDLLSKMLMEKGADVNGQDENGQTPLHLVVLRNRRSICVLFLANNADVNVKDKNGRTLLHLAVLRSDYLPICKLLLSKDCKVNEKDINGMTPLFYATSRGDEELVKLLIQKKANVRVRNNSGETVLHVAAKNNDNNSSSVVDLLLQGRAEPNAQDENGNTPLHCAVEYCLNNDDNWSVTDFFSSMLAWGACMELRNNEGLTPMDRASGNYSHEFLIEHLIKLDSAKLHSHIHYQNHLNPRQQTFQNSCLEELDTMKIITNGHYALIDLLYNYGNATFLCSKEMEEIMKLSMVKTLFPIYSSLLKASYIKSKQRQILISRAESCSFINLPLELLKIILNYLTDKDLENIIETTEKSALMFLEFGPDMSDILQLPESDNQYRGSPLHHAVKNHSLEEVKTLLSKGSVNMETLDCRGETPLHCAVSNDFALGLHLLWEKYANIDIKDEHGNSLLHCAVSNRNESLITFFINKGLDIDSENKDGKTPLHLAINEEHVFVVEILLEKGCNVNKKDKNGCSPLHILLHGGYDRSCYIPICNLLLAKGADVNAQDNNNSTALHLAASIHKALPIFELLLKNGANVNATDNRNKTPLHIAASEFDVRICKALLAKGSEINAQDIDGKTPLHLAIEYRREENVKFLIAKGSDLGAKDNNGMTVLHVAARDHDEVHYIRYLLENGIEIDVQDNDGDTPLHHAVTTDYSTLTDDGDLVSITIIVGELLDWGASVNIKNNAGLTPVEKCLRSEKKDFLIKYIIKLQCANMMQPTVYHKFDSAKFKSYQESCLQELTRIKSKSFGSNNLYQVFSMYNDASYLLNNEMKEAMETDSLKLEYPIYISLLKVTYIKAKHRLLLLNMVEDSLNIKLPSEILRKVLSYIDDNKLRKMTN